MGRGIRFHARFGFLGYVCISFAPGVGEDVGLLAARVADGEGWAAGYREKWTILGNDKMVDPPSNSGDDRLPDYNITYIPT
jgi:hypothetical protein